MSTTPPRSNRGNRGRAAVALRLSGATYSEIADTLDLASEHAAKALIERDLGHDADEPRRNELRNFEALRLEALLKGVWVKATDPAHREHIPAVKAAVAIIDRRIRLLGLDAPEEVVIHTPAAQELEQWVAQVLAADNPALEPVATDG